LCCFREGFRSEIDEKLYRASYEKHLHSNYFAELRERASKLVKRRPDGYWSCRNTGKDITLKYVQRQAVMNSFLTKAYKEIEYELKCFDDPKYRELHEQLKSMKPMSYDSIRMRKKRLLDRLKSFVAFSPYCYFFTVTVKKASDGSVKEDFLYALENIRKEHQKKYGKMHYVGVLERHPKRKNNPLHVHFCAFFEGGYKSYKELWATFGKLGRIDMQPVETNIEGLANYAYKSMLDTITAYLNKTALPESMLLSSKGSPKPVVTMKTQQEVTDMLNTGKFEEKTFALPSGAEVTFFHSESFPEMESLFKELQGILRDEQELLAEQFVNPATHRR
jgi:hypothetical protein